MDDFAMRLEVLGWERSKGIWTMPKGFGSTEYVDRRFVHGFLVAGSARQSIQTTVLLTISDRRILRFWSPAPTNTESLVQMTVAVNAGARGSISWTDPTTTAGIKAALHLSFASALPPFLLSSSLSSPPRPLCARHHVISAGLRGRGGFPRGSRRWSWPPTSTFSSTSVLSAMQFKSLALVTFGSVLSGV
ncbi:hypothetical protein BJY52DRAFT_1283574 [Lactarius psammicola]|nr:hypothetical protein BJY52DRAFT_1283574 [Lactarius psammicola]